jgi:hypothetical protein
VCADAAKGGHLEILRWAHSNGCPWDAATCLHAAKNGHLEVLQWMIFVSKIMSQWLSVECAQLSACREEEWCKSSGSMY